MLSIAMTTVLFFTLGWFGNQLWQGHRTPKKRSRAIPKGTEAEKKPRRSRTPKKAVQDVEQPSLEL